jgi:hypothetical protein
MNGIVGRRNGALFLGKTAADLAELMQQSQY